MLLKQKSWGICVAFIMVCYVTSVHSDSSRLVTLGTIKTRPLSMGGAFSSIRDDLASLDFNPATFHLDPFAGENRFYVYMNPLGPMIFLKNRHAFSDWTVPAGWIIRGIGLSIGRIDMGTLFGEESLGNAKRLSRKDLFIAEGFATQRNASFGFSFALAPKVSLGISGELFIRNDNLRKAKLGYRYGLIIQPRTNITVGLCYADFPNTFRNERLFLEALADETLNIGVSYMPWSFLRLALDIRNVSDEDKAAVREPHAGIEINPITHLALRGGYARSTDGTKETFSAGIGICDLNHLIYKSRSFDHPFFGIQTGWIYEKYPGAENRWFFLSCMIRLDKKL